MAESTTTPDALLLTEGTVRDEISKYSQQHPNDFGTLDGRECIPMKKFVKLFVFKKRSTQEQSLLNSIVDGVCDLELIDGIKVLVLKTPVRDGEQDKEVPPSGNKFPATRRLAAAAHAVPTTTSNHGKRSMKTPAITIAHTKDRTSRRVFGCCARGIKGLQVCTEYEELYDKPLCVHFMGTYDEISEEPQAALKKGGRVFREKPHLNLLVGKDFNTYKHEFAQLLKKAGEEMLKDEDGGRYHTEDHEEFQKRIFGKVQPPITPKKKPKED